MPDNVVRLFGEAPQDDNNGDIDEQAPLERTGGGGGSDGPTKPPNWERKRTNKRINEQLKLFGSGMNALAAALLGASIIVPLVQNPIKFLDNYNPLWFLGGVGLHIIGLVVFGLNYQSED